MEKKIIRQEVFVTFTSTISSDSTKSSKKGKLSILRNYSFSIFLRRKIRQFFHSFIKIEMDHIGQSKKFALYFPLLKPQ